MGQTSIAKATRLSLGIEFGRLQVLLLFFQSLHFQLFLARLGLLMTGVGHVYSDWLKFTARDSFARLHYP